MDGPKNGIQPIPVQSPQPGSASYKSWLTESGRVQLENDFKKARILIVETPEEASTFHYWLGKRYDAFTVGSNEQAIKLMRRKPAEFELVVAARKAPKIDAFLLLDQMLKNNIIAPMLVLLSQSTVLSEDEERLYLAHDVLRKPVTEAMLTQRIQRTLELNDERMRNQAYRKHLEVNLSEMNRLRQLAVEKESAANEVLSALEAPIVAITGALAKVLDTPDLKDSSVRSSLEEIMQLMTGDVYRPALERVMTSDMDPVAISLLQEYWYRMDLSTEEPKMHRKKSSIVASRTGTDDLEMLGLQDWNFDPWAHDTATLRHFLKLIFLSWHTPEVMLEEKKLDAFLKEVEANYLDNPYHCFRHAFDVTQTLFVILGDLESTHTFSHCEVISMLIATLCHDIGHLGKTNKFLVDTQHRLALMYNDKAVLEQYHCAKAFEVLLKPQNNILSSLDKESYRDCRKLIVECILGTDMAEHFSLMGKLEASGASPPSRELMMKTLVHFADISNVAKEWPLAYQWSTLITTEFFNQGDAEKELGLTVEAFMDRTRSNVETNTLNFIKFVCRKFFGVVAAVFPALSKHTAQMESNLARFDRIVRERDIQEGRVRSTRSSRAGSVTTPPLIPSPQDPSLTASPRTSSPLTISPRTSSPLTSPLTSPPSTARATK